MKRCLHPMGAWRRVVLLLILSLPCTLNALAQETRLVSGQVITAQGTEPLPGVNVLIKGTNTGTITDVTGNFSINVPTTNATLVFSFVGFVSKEIEVGQQDFIKVLLDEDVTSLNEVVVVGYGTQQKEDLTGAISVVDTKQLQERQATTVAEAMQGLATGINVRGGGQPGSEARIQIRGLKNLQGTNPLYVIDGLVTTANRDFNPNDIESIQILKDASAAAIYGSRAANGVIIITTKKGKEGPMKVQFSAKSSLQTIPRYDLAGRDEFIRLNDMAYDNAGKPRQDHDLTVNTDWQDETFRTGNIQDYNVSFSGGGDNGSFFVSGNYFGNKGTVIDTEFDRVSFRVNTSAKKGIFSIGENVAISNSKADEISGNPIVDVFRLLPTIPVYDDSHPGGYGYGSEDRARTFGTNPIAIADLADRTNENLRIRGNVWSELQILPFLKYRLNLGYETSSDHYKFLRKEGNWTLNQEYQPSIANENRARSETKLVENTLNFNKEFDQHKINLVVGQTYQHNTYGQINGEKRNLLKKSSGGYYDVLDQGSEPNVGGFENETLLVSYLGRLEYAFADKYLLNFVFRRDGSSVFAYENTWGNFPSVSAAWRISEEGFFDLPWMSNLKLRASYGKLGSGLIPPYQAIPVINSFGTIAIGRDQHIEPGAIQVRLANPDLRWETLTQKDIGLDAEFLNGKLEFTADYFNAETADVLFSYPILLTTGNDGGSPIVNGATVQNTGFEFSVSYREQGREFNYFAALNMSTLNNKVKELGYGLNETRVGNTITTLGEPIGMWYVLQTDGLFQSQSEIDSYQNSDGQVIQPGASPGDIRYKDINDDGEITNEDKAVVGSPWPDVEFGLNLGATYKNFSLSMNWFASVGATVFNGPRSGMSRFDDNSNYLSGVQPWTPDNPNTDFPRVVYASTLNARGDTDRWLEDGDFLRLKYISISYAVPKNLIEKIGFDNAQISVSAQNILTLTKYTGLDPEFNNSNIFERGFDYGAFPNVRMYSLGVQFGF